MKKMNLQDPKLLSYRVVHPDQHDKTVDLLTKYSFKHSHIAYFI